jgi:predicted O-methyltransferase YrrM
MLERIKLNPQLIDYLFDVSLRETDVLRRLREETAALPMAEMQIPAEQGQFLHLLVQLIGAKKTIEVGVFTGYSTLWTAMALPEDGYVVACDTSEEWTAIAQRYWKEAGVAHKIDLRLAPATQTLDHLLAESYANSFDFAFIDADKENYLNYYERALQLVRPGGLIAIDNVLRSGEVIDPAIQEPGTVAIRELNRRLRDDQRITLSMLPLADGLTLALKRG